MNNEEIRKPQATLMEIKYKWQQKLAERLLSMSKKELLDEVLLLAQGDDYDGCFTERGQWEYFFAEDLLRERLKSWLEKD